MRFVDAMTRILRDCSVKTKLRILTTTAVAAALSAACVALVINDMRALRAAKIEQLSALTAVLGANAAATLEFNDPRTARELLASLQCQPSVESAALYDAAGNRFRSSGSRHGWFR